MKKRFRPSKSVGFFGLGVASALGGFEAETSVDRGTKHTISLVCGGREQEEYARAVKTSSKSLYVSSEYFFFVSPSNPYTCPW